MIHEELTERILRACFEVANELGCGFLESVYQKALLVALTDAGLKAEPYMPIAVTFRHNKVGEFIADMVVEDVVLLELKAVNALAPEHLAQVLNYLKATGIPIGLLVNFGHPKLEIRRLGNSF